MNESPSPSNLTSRLRQMMTPEGMQSPIGTEAADEIMRLHAEITQMESAWAFINIWKSRYESERALADLLAEALRWVSDPELCEESHETIIGIWQSTAIALAAYEAARKEANDE